MTVHYRTSRKLLFIYFCLAHPFLLLVAKYVQRSERNEWPFQKAKSTISESVEMSHTIGMEKLQDRLAEESEMYPLCDTIGLAYLTVLRDCEIHCSTEGAEVKALGGLHVIGTSLHESRRIDNQVRGYFLPAMLLRFLYHMKPYGSGDLMFEIK